MNASKKIRVLAALGTLSGAVWAGTFATFTDSATSASTFTAGTVDLVVGGDPDDVYAFTSIEMGNMKPGDVKYAPLTVANAGSLGFTYSLATSATGTTLKDKLQLGARKVADAATCDALGAGYDAALVTSQVINEGALSAAAISNRALASGSEVLCVKVQLPSDADNSYQAQTTTATFTLSATQS